MMQLTSFCEMHWLWPWLLPFLLGLLLGWWLWSRYKGMVASLQSQITGLNSELSNLKNDLADCKARRADVEGDLSLTKGRMREMEAALLAMDPSFKNTSKMTAAATESSKLTSSNIDDSEIAASSADDNDLAGALHLKEQSHGPKGFLGLKSDNLQIIEGVGTKMESLLKENGYSTWASIANTTTEKLQAMLDSYGDKYRIIDPVSWVAQAKLANSGEWNQLVELQKNLDGGKPGVGSSAAKVEKMLYKLGLKRSYTQDDLKVVEGIGPKIAQLLTNAGIDTWAKLANASVTQLQKILDDAGPSMQLADPGTWPTQAGMADRGEWEKLEEYQDFLQGGKA